MRSRRDKKDLGRDDGDLAKITGISPRIFVVVSPVRKLIHPMTSTYLYGLSKMFLSEARNLMRRLLKKSPSDRDKQI